MLQRRLRSSTCSTPELIVNAGGFAFCLVCFCLIYFLFRRPFKVLEKSGKLGGKPTVQVKYRGEQHDFVSFHCPLFSLISTYFLPDPRGNFCNGSWQDEGDR